MRKLIYFFAQLIIEVIELSFRQALTMYPGFEDLGKENLIRKLFKKGRMPKQIKEEQIKEAYRRHFYGL